MKTAKPITVNLTLTLETEDCKDAWREYNDGQDREDRARWGEVNRMLKDESNAYEAIEEGVNVTDADEYTHWCCEQL